MLAKPEFKRFSSKVVLFLHNTSRVDDEPYPNLLREKGGNGFPTVSYLDASGRLLTQMPFPTRSTEQLELMLGRLERWRAQRKKYEAGDKKLAVPLFLQEMKLGMLPFATADQRFAELRSQLSAPQQEAIAADLVNMEFAGVAQTITRDRKTLLAAGEKFVAMLDKGRIPTSRQVITFWQAALAFAESRRDVDMFEKVFKAAKQAMAGDPRAERYMGRVERRLEALRKGR